VDDGLTYRCQNPKASLEFTQKTNLARAELRYGD